MRHIHVELLLANSAAEGQVDFRIVKLVGQLEVFLGRLDSFILINKLVHIGYRLEMHDAAGVLILPRGCLGFLPTPLEHLLALLLLVLDPDILFFLGLKVLPRCNGVGIRRNLRNENLHVLRNFLAEFVFV